MFYSRHIEIETKEKLEQPISREEVESVTKTIFNNDSLKNDITESLDDKIIKSEDDHQKKNNQKEKKTFSKKYHCDKCDKKYTWYSGLANHKRFVHNKVKEGKEM